MAGVMGLAPTCLQRDGLASRLLRLHAQMAAATGFAPVRPGSEPGRLLLPHAAMEQHGGCAPPNPVWKVLADRTQRPSINTCAAENGPKDRPCTDDLLLFRQALYLD